jgi:hypothetical protein
MGRRGGGACARHIGSILIRYESSLFIFEQQIVTRWIQDGRRVVVLLRTDSTWRTVSDVIEHYRSWNCTV